MADRTRLLADLRVIELRSELDKRNLPMTGVRGVLIQRLTKYLEEKGEDPKTFVFEIASSEAKTPSKRAKRTESTVETLETPTLEDMVVQDDVGEDDDTEATNDSKETMEVEPSNISRKRESSDISNGVQAKKTCVEKDIKTEDDHKISENNTDAEDSINLDIGEDELLNDEAEHSTKIKKDEEQDEGGVAVAGDGDSAADKLTTGDADKDASVNSEAPATSENTDEKKDKDQLADDKGNEKEKRDDNKDSGPRNLWVSGLSGDTRAKDLKQLCSKHGKVIGAKVVTNARTPGSRCYGYVTMASAQDAEGCIKNLHRTELHGRLISVEKAKSESESGSRRHAATRHSDRDGDHKDDAEGNDNADKAETKPKKEDGSERSASENKDKVNKSDKDKTSSHRNTKSREHRRSATKDVLSFSKIWKSRDITRARERSRAAREDERRRRAAEDALRERERRQRQERHRLELEREKLRSEREKIEREKNELLRLERERHRLEREKLELERMELKRAQLRLEEERRKRSAAYESSSSYRKSSPPASYERDARHKRPPPPPLMSSRSQFEAPPPPRFELAPAYERATDKRDRDYKREYPRHVSSTSSMKYPPNGSSADDSRTPMPPSSRPKEPSRNTYESRESRPFRPSPAKPEPRAWTSARYQDSMPAKGGSNSEQWSSNTNPSSSEARYGTSYEARYPAAYAAPPAAYAERYPARDYRAKY